MNTVPLSSYKTIAKAAEAEHLVQKSRFIARCFPAETEAEAARHLTTLRKRYYDATHHCYAYRIGSRCEAVKSSDDGEPSGTAGRPILEVLTQRDVTGLLLVVTRYFGGILLGAGGLVRAYTKAAALALDAAGIAEMRVCSLVDVQLSYATWDSLQAFLRLQGICEWDVAYTDSICCRFWIVSEQEESLLAMLHERFYNALRITVAERKLRAFVKEG